jgi:hypothetical protein
VPPKGVVLHPLTITKPDFRLEGCDSGQIDDPRSFSSGNEILKGRTLIVSFAQN